MSSGTRETDKDNMRLDKWLWCARFFKTRSQAAAAIRSGKVKVEGNRPKPAKTVTVGEALQIRKGPYEYRITVDRLSSQRLSAADAVSLYSESADSISEREQLAVQLKAESAAQPRPKRRPTKRERREIMRFNKRQRES